MLSNCKHKKEVDEKKNFERKVNLPQLIFPLRNRYPKW